MTSTPPETTTKRFFPLLWKFSEPRDDTRYCLWLRGTYNSAFPGILEPMVLIRLHCQKSLLHHWQTDSNAVPWQETMTGKITDALPSLLSIIDVFDTFAAGISKAASMAGRLEYENTHWPATAEVLQQELETTVKECFLPDDHLDRHPIQHQANLNEFVDSCYYDFRPYRIVIDFDDLQLEVILYADFKKDEPSEDKAPAPLCEPVRTPPPYHQELTFTHWHFQNSCPAIYEKLFLEVPERPCITVDMGYQRHMMTLLLLPKEISWTETMLQTAITNLKDRLLSLLVVQQNTSRSLTVADLDVAVGASVKALQQLVAELVKKPVEVITTRFRTAPTLKDFQLVDSTVWLQSLGIKTEHLDLIINMGPPPWEWS